MLFLCITLATLALAFGQKSQNISVRITGGSDTTIEQHPYQLAIELYGKQDCGASLLKPNLALTAAHCAVVNTDLMRIRAGSTTAEQGGQLVKVSDKHVHPNYVTSSHDYDVAVLILETPLVIGGGVQTIPLQAIGAEIPDGTMGTITGWGDLTNTGPPATTLQVAQVPKINQQTCINNYPNKVTDRMFCFGYQDQGGVDPCVGDSGGPLVVSGKQVGIISWGEDCGVPRQPGVYVKISNKAINDFITQYM